MRRQGTVRVRFDAKRVEDKLKKEMKLAHANRVFSAMKFATKVALENTPAWTGDTRANYRWNIGRKGTQYQPYNQGRHWRSKDFPIASSADADGRSLAALEAMRPLVYSNPYQLFVFFNNVEYEGGMNILDLEYGSLTGTPHMPMAKARQAVEARLS